MFMQLAELHVAFQKQLIHDVSTSKYPSHALAFHYMNASILSQFEKVSGFYGNLKYLDLTRLYIDEEGGWARCIGMLGLCIQLRCLVMRSVDFRNCP